MRHVIQVQVRRVLYRNESCWTVLETDQGKCNGVIMFEPNEGDRLKLDGDWKEEGAYGRQFKFSGACLDVPTDSRALLHYAVTITKGLGESREAEVWRVYGEAWREQERLNIPGLTEKTQFAWQDTLAKLDEQIEQTQAITFLLAHKCSINLATLAWEKWKQQTIGVVQEDPFILATLPHYGFGDVDGAIRLAFGIADNDPRRYDAATLYCLGKIISDTGSTCVTWDTLFQEAAKYVPVKDSFDHSIRRLIDAGRIMLVDATTIARTNDYDDEKRVWERFKRTV